MKRALIFIAVAAFVVIGVVTPRPTASASEAQQAAPLRYPEIEPIFAKCSSCHDARKSKNAAAQAVFEMSSYPFATKRPATLLDDLKRTLPKRGLSETDKQLGVRWLEGGALDASGRPPIWR